jgi:hypothetical protein
MALATETNQVVSQFELTSADVNSHVKEFLRQMGTALSPPILFVCANQVNIY